jgi:hypothetical protein
MEGGNRMYKLRQGPVVVTGKGRNETSCFMKKRGILDQLYDCQLLKKYMIQGVDRYSSNALLLSSANAHVKIMKEYFNSYCFHH